MTNEFDKKYFHDLKSKLKSWESEFYSLNKRKPGKDDIRVASIGIKDAYKEYWSYKTLRGDLINGDVWSEKFNKPHIEHVTLKTNKNFKALCFKLNEKCKASQKFDNIVQPDFSKAKLSTQVTEPEKHSASSSLDSPLKLRGGYDSKFGTKILKKNSCKKVKSINILTSAINQCTNEGSFLVGDNIDTEWLKRCNDDTNKKGGIILNTTTDETKLFIPLQSKSIEERDFDESHKCEISLKSGQDSLNSTFLPSVANGRHSLVSTSSAFSSNEVLHETTRVTDENTNDLTKLEEVVHSPNPNAGENIIPESNMQKGIKRKLKRDCHSQTYLEKKMISGTLNENYVKVNIKKKKFSRGHRSVNIRKLKWKKWKERKHFENKHHGAIPSACFKCGQMGHWAKNCRETTKRDISESLCDDIEEVPLPTLEEASELARKQKLSYAKVKPVKLNESSTEEGEVGSQEGKNCEFSSHGSTTLTAQPLYELVNGKLKKTPKEVFDSLKELKYSDFRPGQEKAVMRILTGLSTLVILPTGSGKSLCYQLPAYIYAKHSNSIALVISPLVSLMEDQVTGLPSGLCAVCLHSGLTDAQREKNLKILSSGQAQILLLSPEAVIGNLGLGWGVLPFSMPLISFACIDEAHCLSQWSHHFRPSYLQLYKVLTQRLGVKCILGLTATANRSTVKEVIYHLGLENIDECVIGGTGIPTNLHLSASRDKNKDKALIQLLTGDRFSKCSSIIIYCIRRTEAERLASVIRTSLQDQVSDEPPPKKSKSKLKKPNFLWTVEAYHAGLAPCRRRSIQKQFMTGKLRVVVATVAFGMGLDKRDVRAVIHYNMPKSFESYVQEIGRAGRDGYDAHCHLFLESEGKDFQELKRYIYSNGADRHTIRKLLKKVFVPCKCREDLDKEETNPKGISECEKKCSKCPKHEIAFSINDTVQALDLKEECINTLLCYLELHPKKWIDVLSPVYSKCTLKCYGGHKQLKSIAHKNPAIATAMTLDIQKGKELGNTAMYEFPIIEISSLMGWNSAVVKRDLKQLEWNENKRKSGVITEFSDLSFHLQSPGDLSDDELDIILNFLHKKIVSTEEQEMKNLQSLFQVFKKYSHSHYWSCSDEVDAAFSEGIKQDIGRYFIENEQIVIDTKSEDVLADKIDIDISEVKAHIRDLIITNSDQNFSGRSIARIFYGISSPCFPSEVWGRVKKFWRSQLHINFNLLIKFANEELRDLK